MNIRRNLRIGLALLALTLPLAGCHGYHHARIGPPPPGFVPPGHMPPGHVPPGHVPPGHMPPGHRPGPMPPGPMPPH